MLRGSSCECVCDRRWSVHTVFIIFATLTSRCIALQALRGRLVGGVCLGGRTCLVYADNVDTRSDRVFSIEDTS